MRGINSLLINLQLGLFHRALYRGSQNSFGPSSSQNENFFPYPVYLFHPLPFMPSKPFFYKKFRKYLPMFLGFLKNKRLKDCFSILEKFGK
jgi:hypothetical protein